MASYEEVKSDAESDYDMIATPDTMTLDGREGLELLHEDPLGEELPAYSAGQNPPQATEKKKEKPKIVPGEGNFHATSDCIRLWTYGAPNSAYIQATCFSRLGKPIYSHYDLNRALRNGDGRFQWVDLSKDGPGNFGYSARGLALSADGVLTAELRNRNGKWCEASVRLSEKMENVNGNLRYLGEPSDKSASQSPELAAMQGQGYFHATSQEIGLERGHLLRAKCFGLNGRLYDTHFDLDTVLGNENGQFRWLEEPGGDRGAFSHTARKMTLIDGGKTLKGELKARNGIWRPAQVSLANKIDNVDGRLCYVYNW